MTYKDQIKHPKWQRKRFEIMERDKFQCQGCFDSETTLNVHHKEYHKNKKVWEYENKYLITLCENCHSQIHLAENTLNSVQLKRSKFYNINLTDLCILEFRIIELNKQQGSIKSAIELLTSQIIKKD